MCWAARRFFSRRAGYDDGCWTDGDCGTKHVSHPGRF
nr:MAG TPA: hypothetical protein [Caudoviricetes sp.]